ncbi:MAG: ABC transporter permease, partial [Duncaniella sp.]|nr:ABC transporter permease [Duncaniella sp.]
LSDNIRIRNGMTCVVFLLIVIFLGFLGTFWFRTQQRTEEMAVRIVNGATRRDIFRRFIGEGIILLTIATLIALPVEILIVYYDLVSEFIMTYNYVTFRSIEIYQSFALVVAVLALLIVGGIWFPARKAMNVDPAYALKDL